MGKFWDLIPDSIKLQDPNGILKHLVDAIESIYERQRSEISQLPTLGGPYDVDRGSILTGTVQAEADDKFTYSGPAIDLNSIELGQFIGVPDDLMIGVALNPYSGPATGDYRIITDWDSATGIAIISPPWSSTPFQGDLIEVCWPNFIDLTEDASIDDGYYTGMWLRIAAGPGSNPVEYRQISEYDGDARRAYVDVEFNTPPDRTSVFEVVPYHVGLQHLASDVGWILDGDEPEALQREQIAQAVNAYKLKGTVRGFELVFRAFGFLANIQELSSNYASAPSLLPGVCEESFRTYTTPPDELIEDGKGRQYIKDRLAEGKYDTDDFNNRAGDTSQKGNLFLTKWGWLNPVFDTGEWALQSWASPQGHLYEYATLNNLVDIDRNLLIRRAKAGSYTFELQVDLAYFGNNQDDFMGGLVFHYADHQNYYAAYYYAEPGGDTGLTNFRVERVRNGISTVLFETTSATALNLIPIPYSGQPVYQTLKIESRTRRSFKVSFGGVDVVNINDPGDPPAGLSVGLISHRDKTGIPHSDFVFFDDFAATYQESGLRIPHSDIAIYIKRLYPGIQLNDNVMQRIQRRLEDIRPIHVNIDRIAFLEAPMEDVGVSDYLEGTFVNFPEDLVSVADLLTFVLFEVLKTTLENIGSDDSLEVWSPVRWSRGTNTRWGVSNSRYNYGQIHHRS